MIQKRRQKATDFSNVDVVLLALHRLNGQYKYIVTEDIAVAANEIAPGRFSWKKYKDQINLEHIRVYLFDARKSEKGSLIIGNNNDGWMLTERGAEYASGLAERSEEVDLSRVKQSPEERRKEQWIERERQRMAGSGVVSHVEQHGPQSISLREAERFFKLDEYIKGTSRERKIERIVRALGHDPEIGPAIRMLAQVVREK